MYAINQAIAERHVLLRYVQPKSMTEQQSAYYLAAKLLRLSTYRTKAHYEMFSLKEFAPPSAIVCASIYQQTPKRIC